MDRYQIEPKTVAEAKQQLRAPVPKADYLAPVREHPVASVGAAFVAGMLIRRAGNVQFPPSLLSIGLHLLKKL